MNSKCQMTKVEGLTQRVIIRHLSFVIFFL